MRNDPSSRRAVMMRSNASSWPLSSLPPAPTGGVGLAWECLVRIREPSERLGGSHAGRDLLSGTMSEDALGCGGVGLARALSAERSGAMPDKAPAARRRARALEGLELA